MRRRRGQLLARALLAAAALALAVPAVAGAGRQELPVVIVPGLQLDDLEGLVGRGAVGLVVAGAGPRVSPATALAALERGEVRNSLRGGIPAGPTLIDVETSTVVPEGPAIVLALPEGGDQSNERRFPLAIVGAGLSGILRSDTTRIDGLVSIADIAPAALGEEGALVAVPSPDPLAQLHALDRRIDRNADSRPRAALLLGVLVLALAAVSPRSALLGIAAGLATNLALGAAGVSSTWLVLLAIGLAVGVGGPALGLLARSPLAIGSVLAAVVAGSLLALGLDGEAVALSPLGPGQTGRFYGLSNLLSAALLVPALGGAALLYLGSAAPAAVAAGVLGLVTVAGSRFGADGGTAIVLVAAYALLAVELAGARRRAAVAVALLAAAAVAALLALDAVSGASSHLTDAVGGGPGGLAEDLGDRVVLAYERATEHWYTAVLVAVGSLVLLALATRLARSSRQREVRALPLSLALATGVSLFVNDSPLDVVSMGLVGYLTTQAYALRELPAPGPDADYASVET